MAPPLESLELCDDSFHPHQIVQMLRDGSCLFHSLSQSVHGNTTLSLEEGKLKARFATSEGRPVRRLRFTGSDVHGHYDVLFPIESAGLESIVACMQPSRGRDCRTASNHKEHAISKIQKAKRVVQPKRKRSEALKYLKARVKGRIERL
ncbi:hypothetical protein JTE90_005226 [Oedothorax gibbosus]|uniref:OTU domain-containing protein n=1 Tax=Oedothorax gibbosus TaxID=931172 RepID=A0AAV6TKW6_9ARAC|nr:hypothetical protein JTE90_005226 [Oedothorax gibbosus]